MIVKTENCYQVIWIKCYYDTIGFSRIGIFVIPNHTSRHGRIEYDYICGKNNDATDTNTLNLVIFL